MTENKATEQKMELKTKGGEVLVESAINDKEAKEIKQLYDHSQTLDNAENVSKHEASYLAILGAVKGSVKAKQLASQLIPKYLKHFKNLSDRAFNALIDLCEDPLKEVRIHAIRNLPNLCKDTEDTSIVSQVANVIVQLLADTEEDPLNVETAKNSFIIVLRIDTKTALKSLFQQMEDEAQIREKAIAFLQEKVIAQEGDLIHKSPENEKFLADEIKKVLPDTTSNEYRTFLEILQSLKIFHSDEGKQELVNFIASQSGIDETKGFNPEKDISTLDKLLSTIKVLTPFFEKTGEQASKFYSYLVKKVLPHFDTLTEKLQLLRGLADVSAYITPSDAKETLGTVYELLKKYLPLKPNEGEPDPELNFSFIEILLYTFHQAARKAPGILNTHVGVKSGSLQPGDDLADYPEKRKDFFGRLYFVQKQCDTYQKKLNEQRRDLKLSKNATEEETVNFERKMRQNQIAKDAVVNILKMINSITKAKKDKDVKFLDPKEITLSFNRIRSDKKRKGEQRDVPESKKRKLYEPPHRREGSQRGRGRGGRRGRGRGRGRGGRWGRGGRGKRY